jgi:signal transduction histidine kinase
MHDRLLEGYCDLAALGQAAIGVSRSIQPHLDSISDACTRIRSGIKGPSSRTAMAPLRTLEESLAVIRDRVAMIAPMETSANQRRRALDVPAELAVFRGLVRPLLDAAAVDLEVVTPEGGVLRVEMRPENFHRLLHILATNSLEWLDGIRKPRIRITSRPALDDRCEIVFSDNGPGVPPAIADRIFEPFLSGKKGGRGMGLTIAKSIVELHGGEISAIVDGRRRGANIRMLLPRKRSRATIHQ